MNSDPKELIASARNELGRRLLAALMSYRLGIGLDYCLKTYVPEVVDSRWGQIGLDLLEELRPKLFDDDPPCPKGSPPRPS